MPEITVNILSSAGASQKTPFKVDTESKISQLKETIKTNMHLTTENSSLRLIFSGRILKDDDSVEGSKLVEGSTIHLVRLGSAPPKESAITQQTQQAQTPPQPQQTVPFSAMFRGAPMGGQAPNPGALGNATSIPGFNANPEDAAAAAGLFSQNPALLQQTMDWVAANPAIFQQLVANDPRLAQMTPEMRQLFTNPDVMRAILSMHQSQSQRQGGDGAGSPSEFGDAQTGYPDPAFLAALAAQQGATNPLIAGGASGQPAGPPEERFKDQIQQLNDMGFWDKDENIRVLLLTAGNVNAAVEILLRRPGFQ